MLNMSKCIEDNLEFYQQITAHIKKHTKYNPEIGIICGSGLGTLAQSVEDPEILPYSSIPHFPVSTVPGHTGNLVFGRLSGKNVVLMQGRIHPYEGHGTKICAMPVRIMHLLGVKILLATTATGGINPEYEVGDFVVVKDHVSIPAMAGFNPLVGPNDDNLGLRFIAISDAYDKGLQKLALDVAKQMNLDKNTHNGVYFNQFGPCFETIAECRLIQTLGGDVVGMSLAHEVIVARHMGMRVLAISLVTNKAILDYESTAKANHEEVLETGKQRAEVMKGFIREIVSKIQI